MLNRRSFMIMAAVLATSDIGALGAEPEKEQDVSPPEDLMREHGLLNRILLIYDHAHTGLSTGKAFPMGTLHESANIIKSFIEDYHERLEEEYLFPRFEKAGKLVELVRTLKAQHDAGRQLTTGILGLTSSSPSEPERSKLLDYLASFNRMYRPHEAREDTVLFPALRSIVSAHEFDALGEEFEAREHKLFGKEGFEGVVAQVSDIEKKLGIYDLAQFTPKVVTN